MANKAKEYEAKDAEQLLDSVAVHGPKQEWDKLEEACWAVVEMGRRNSGGGYYITPVYAARACWWLWLSRTQRGDREGRWQALVELGKVMQVWEQTGPVNCDKPTPQPDASFDQAVERKRLLFFRHRHRLATLAHLAFDDPSIGASEDNPLPAPNVEWEYKFLREFLPIKSPGGIAVDGLYQMRMQRLVRGLDCLTLTYTPAQGDDKSEKTRDFWFDFNVDPFD